MAQTAELVRVEHLPNGQILVVFSDKLGFVFNDLGHMKMFAESLEERQDLAKRLLIAWWFARDSEFKNADLVRGRRLTFNLGGANPIRVT